MDGSHPATTQRRRAVHIADVVMFCVLAAAGSAACVGVYVFGIHPATRDALTTIGRGALVISAAVAVPVTRRFMQSRVHPERHMPDLDEWWLVPFTSAIIALTIFAGLVIGGSVIYLAFYGVGTVVT